MREKVKELCDLFIENKKSIEKGFKLESVYMTYVAAAQLSAKGQVADVQKLRECEKVLNKSTGALSEFRGHAKLPMLVKLADKEDGAAFIQEVSDIEKQFKKGIADSTYRLLTAISIAESAEEFQQDSLIETTKEIYKDMKAHHKFLTDYEDMPAAALLAMSKRPVEVISEDMETCFNLLKKKFRRSNSTQSAAQILALSDMPAEIKAQRLIDLYDALKAEKCYIGSGYKEFSILACLAINEMEINDLVSELKEADLYIKGHKGFGNFSFDATKRRMYAALMVLSADDTTTAFRTSAISSTIATEIASAIATEVAIMCSLIATTSAVAAASHH